MENEEIDLTKELLNKVQEVLDQTDLTTVSSKGNTNFENLPNGYYLCEVKKAELTYSKSTKKPMIAFVFEIIEKGWTYVEDDSGNAILTEINNNVKNYKIFKYYTLDTPSNVQRYVSDMLKFEGDVSGEPILPKETFTTAEVLVEALQILIGLRIYVNVTNTVDKNNNPTSWKNLISWKKAQDIELPF